MKKLTDKEIAFAENHHLLINNYLSMKSLSFNEFYDIAAIGYMKAVKDYLRRCELQKYSFCTIAFAYIRREIGVDLKKLYTFKRKSDLYSTSLNKNIKCTSEYEGEELINFIGYEDTNYEAVLNTETNKGVLDYIEKYVGEKELKMVKLICRNTSLNYSEISRRLGKNRNYINNCLQTIRNKLKPYESEIRELITD